MLCTSGGTGGSDKAQLGGTVPEAGQGAGTWCSPIPGWKWKSALSLAAPSGTACPHYLPEGFPQLTQRREVSNTEQIFQHLLNTSLLLRSLLSLRLASPFITRAAQPIASKRKPGDCTSLPCGNLSHQGK